MAKGLIVSPPSCAMAVRSRAAVASAPARRPAALVALAAFAVATKFGRRSEWDVCGVDGFTIGISVSVISWSGGCM
eukprot:10813832-Prorocentrum_lima.AAC.1